jgi:predicted lipoprotein with Yx(FWY)xxD motif
VVTDSNGMTLYRFDQDTANPPATHCAGQCAVKWPPALVTGDGTVTVQGVDRSLVGTVTRPDGSRQLTLHGWPLYRFANDAAPGDAKGQGVGGTWFAATPQGAKATTHASTGGNDYGY